MKFVDKYQVSPVVEELYKPDFSDTDQLRFERRLREKIAKRDISYPKIIDSSSWEYYYSHGDSYVDKSTFYSELMYVQFSTRTNLHAEKAGQVELTLWTYGAVTIFFNGKKVLEDSIPCYKPIKKNTFSVDVEKGDNELFVYFQNLGVRDTRNLFGISYEESAWYSFSTFDKAECSEISSWLDNIVLDKNVLTFPSSRDDIELGYDLASPDYGKVKIRYSWKNLPKCDRVEIPEGNPYVLVRVQGLKRRFEIEEYVTPDYPGVMDKSENCKRMLKVIADAEGLSRGDKFGFYIQCILARKALGRVNPNDEAHFYETLDQIERRFDCSDFLISGVIRYMKNYEISSDLEARIKEVLLNYRYWMTMDGSDAMCFWSENHSLLFYSCAMLVGAMYPDEYFPRSKMTGSELSEFGKRLTLEWMDDLEEYGYEEFLSTVYMNVTLACLLNIIDYAEKDISDRARKITDLMIHELSLHTFDGSIIAPMGRVYRGVINPFNQGAQALMNLIEPSCPTSFGEGWLSYWATSSYEFPKDVKALMESSVEKEYSTGDALIRIKKEKDYIVTSVQSPRMDGFVRWHNVTLEDDTEKYKNTHAYTKSFNERFHGTTFFEPGTFGYQQHMWSVALSGEALIFANNPGASSDSSSMRPGYWYGNGVMPALKQTGNMIGAIYSLGEDYPIQFTHLFLPICKFDSFEKDGDWIFVTKDDGKAAIWCSTKLESYNDEIANSEFRAYGDKSAYLVIAEGRNVSLDALKEKAKALTPKYDSDKNELIVNGELFLRFIKSNDKTQFI